MKIKSLIKFVLNTHKKNKPLPKDIVEILENGQVFSESRQQFINIADLDLLHLLRTINKKL
jgi:hypothetical protein